jgi:hypothetical protein
MGVKWPRILQKVTTSTSLLGSFTCGKARHGTDGFTSPPKEGVLRIFSPEISDGFRPGLNPRTWVPKASTLPLDHRSRSIPTSTLRYVLHREMNTVIYFVFHIYCNSTVLLRLFEALLLLKINSLSLIVHIFYTVLSALPHILHLLSLIFIYEKSVTL